MPWAYVHLEEVDSEMVSIESKLRKQRDNARTDSASQRARNDIEAWKAFLSLMLQFEDLGKDPKNFLAVERQFASPAPSLFTAKKSPYNIVYERDPVGRIATGLAVFHDRDRDKALRRTFF